MCNHFFNHFQATKMLEWGWFMDIYGINLTLSVPSSIDGSPIFFSQSLEKTIIDRNAGASNYPWARLPPCE